MLKHVSQSVCKTWVKYKFLASITPVIIIYNFKTTWRQKWFVHGQLGVWLYKTEARSLNVILIHAYRPFRKFLTTSKRLPLPFCLCKMDCSYPISNLVA